MNTEDPVTVEGDQRPRTCPAHAGQAEGAAVWAPEEPAASPAPSCVGLRGSDLLGACLLFGAVAHGRAGLVAP